MTIDHLKQRLLDIIQTRVTALIPACLDAVRGMCPTMPKDYKIGFSTPNIDLGRQFVTVVLRINNVSSQATVRVCLEHFDRELTALVTEVCTAYARPYLVKPERVAEIVRES